MKKNFLVHFFLLCIFSSSAQKKTELLDFMKQLMPDSSEYAEMGDWAVGKPSKFPVKWKEDRVIMSDDEKINFFRTGKAMLTINGKLLDNNGKGAGWDVMLKGPRSGYTSFTLASPADRKITARLTPDSLLGSKGYKATLLKACDKNSTAGYNYYRFMVPGKATSFLKLGWNCGNGDCVQTIDVYDDWSKQYADLGCR